MEVEVEEEDKEAAGAAALTAESTTPTTPCRSRTVRVPLCMVPLMRSASSSSLRSESSAFISARVLASAREINLMVRCCPNMKSIVPCTAPDVSGWSFLIFNIAATCFSSSD